MRAKLALFYIKNDGILDTKQVKSAKTGNILIRRRLIESGNKNSPLLECC